MPEPAPACLRSNRRRNKVVSVSSGTVENITTCNQVRGNGLGLRRRDHSFQQIKTMVQVHMFGSKPVQSVQYVTNVVKFPPSR